MAHLDDISRVYRTLMMPTYSGVEDAGFHIVAFLIRDISGTLYSQVKCDKLTLSQGLQSYSYRGRISAVSLLPG